MPAKINLPEQEIIDKYNNGLSIYKLSKEYNCSIGPITKVLKENNIKMKGSEFFNRKYFFNEHFFSKENINNNEINAYWFGFFCGDGHLMDKRCITIRLELSDKYHLELFAKHIGYNGQIFEYKIYQIKPPNTEYKWYYSCGIWLYSRSMGTYMADELGILSNKSANIKFPDWLEEKQWPHFIRGLFDADGCVHYKNETEEIKRTGFDIVGSKYMMSRCNDIIYEKCNLKKKSKIHKEKQSNEVYTFKYSGYQLFKIKDYLYKDATVYLQRKYDKFFNMPEEAQPGISTDELSNILNVSRDTILNWKDNGFLECVEFRGKYRFEENAIDKAKYLMNNSMTIEEVSKETGLSTRKLNDMKDRNDINIINNVGMYNRILKEDVEKIKNKYEYFQNSITIQEAADILGTSVSTISNWGNSGIIKIIKNNNEYNRVLLSDVEKLKEIRSQVKDTYTLKEVSIMLNVEYGLLNYLNLDSKITTIRIPGEKVRITQNEFERIKFILEKRKDSLTFLEIANFFNVAQGTAIKWGNDGKIKSFKDELNGISMVSKEEFERFKKYIEQNPIIKPQEKVLIQEWSQDEINKLYELMNQGTSPGEIAKQLERSKSSINHKIIRLDINYDYDEVCWQRGFECLKKYKEEFGNTQVKDKSKYQDFSLGVWVSSQRQKYHKNKLSQDKIDILNEIDFIWEPQRGGYRKKKIQCPKNS